MRLSESLKKNIMKPAPGGIVHKFKVKPRRTVFVPEDILANYIAVCESKGYGKNFERMSKLCSTYVAQKLMPDEFRKISFHEVYGSFLTPLWNSIGLMDYIKVESINGRFLVETKNEFLTRIIFQNDFMKGFHSGVLSVILGEEVGCVNASVDNKICVYELEKTGGRTKEPRTRSMPEYNKLNSSDKNEGFTLKDALDFGLFQLKDNIISFRKRNIIPVECTIFHIVGNENIMMDQLSEVSRSYFQGLVEDASAVKKLALLKNLLEAAGWGNVYVLMKPQDEIMVQIKNPPYGFEIRDNWNFLARMILGYLCAGGKKYRLRNLRHDYKYVEMLFSG